MEIQPASLSQVRAGRDGRRFTITDDVGGVAAKLREVDQRLRLRFNERGEFFEVVEVNGTDERRVTTALECDDRLVHRMRELARPDHDYAGELERIDRAADRENDRRFSERSGEIAERLAHHVRKDIGATHRIIVPRDVA